MSLPIPVIHGDAKRAMEQLSNFSNEELDQMLNNDEKISEIIENIENSCIKELEERKESILAENKSIAEFNLSREPDLTEGRSRLQLLYEEIEKFTKSIDEKTSELRQKGGDISLETALALLQTAASEMEEESDKCAKKFLDSEIELENFLDEFQVKRKLMHTRLVKADKLSKILQRGDPSIGVTVPEYINTPPVNINKGYFPGIPNLPLSPPAGGVPYPTGPLNMPMPPGMGYYPNY
ncbi:vacuolar protein sorting-associated protein 37B [Euwallacea similis]|uniref:vacuolar protein sorting-associated protein 37B n=1 Tax=Euwallacea similis TaxID=1736056 RepID=UPI00344E012C